MSTKSFDLEGSLTTKNKIFLQKALAIPEKINIAVVYPLNIEAIKGAIITAEAGIANPIFIGPKKEMDKLSKQIEKDLSEYECFDVAEEEESSVKAVDLVKEGKIDAIVKGSLETSNLLKPIISKKGLGCNRRISNCYICDIPLYHKPIIYTDVGINVAPDGKTKKDIILNAIDVAHALGIKRPKIAILSCIEKVKEYIPSTIDAQELMKLYQEKVFSDAIIEGPLSFDIAISKQVADEKGFSSQIAGDPDILLFPNLDAGNIAVKQLEYFGKAQCGSLALGSKVPVLINSRNTSAKERALSCIFAKLYTHFIKSI